MKKYESNTITGTGAAINVDLGYTPAGVKVINLTTGAEIVWYDGMVEGSCFKRQTAWDTDVVLETTCAIGSTPANVSNTAFKFAVDGQFYEKAAVTAGTAPSATTIPESTYGLFGFEIGSDGTIDKKDAAGNATGYADEATAIAALPTASSSHVLFMYVTVTSSATTGFVGATTSLAATTVSAKYYSIQAANNPQTGGITPIDLGDHATIHGGFTLGTDSEVNVSGDVLYYEVWRGE